MPAYRHMTRSMARGTMHLESKVSHLGANLNTAAALIARALLQSAPRNGNPEFPCPALFKGASEERLARSVFQAGPQSRRTFEGVCRSIEKGQQRVRASLEDPEGVV